MASKARAAAAGDAKADLVLLRRIAALPPDEQAKVMRAMSDRQAREFRRRWTIWAHDGQLPPPGDWRVWLIRAGRGFGKTRAGAEWVWDVARTVREARIALVAGTIDDARRVMIEGPSGLIRVARDDERIDWRATSGEVHWPNGAVATVYSAETPDRLRGPEHCAAWCDELAKWRRGDETWDNLTMTMRIGDAPRVVVTTTPRPTALMRRVIGAAGGFETRGSTSDNPHLADGFAAQMCDSYAGTPLGRQELEGELIDDVEGALWTRGVIEACRAEAAPMLKRVVVAVDPPAGIGGDACGIVVVGLGADGIGYVIEDASVHGASPEEWAAVVVECARAHGADRVLAESNQGGEMIRTVLQAAGLQAGSGALPLELVRAVDGKAKRAEPVSLLYRRGRVRHVGAFERLEDELCGMLAAGGYDGPGRSPDRADALVWAVGELMLGARGKASVRAL